MTKPHLLHVFTTFDGGGQAIRFVRLSNHFGDRFSHSVVAMDRRYGCIDLLDPAVPARVLPIGLNKTSGISLGNLRRCRTVLKEQAPDLLLTYNWGSIEWAAANRLRPLCPQLHFEDGFGPEEAGGNQIARRILFRRLALRNSDIVVPSRVLLNIAQVKWRLRSDQVHYIPNGVDLTRFARRPSIDKRTEIMIGSVGALRPEKNFARLIRAVARIPSRNRVRLVVVGDGAERPMLERLAVQMGVADRVAFAGQVADPETILADLDIFALTSDTEQMPLSVLEAMAAGLPIVATDVGDIAAMLAPDNRELIVPKEDEEALVDRLEGLVQDVDRRRRLGEANRRWAIAHFGEDRMLATYDTLFSRALRQRCVQ